MMKTKTNKYEENACIYENNKKNNNNYIKQKGVYGLFWGMIMCSGMLMSIWSDVEIPTFKVKIIYTIWKKNVVWQWSPSADDLLHKHFGLYMYNIKSNHWKNGVFIVWTI